MERVARITAVGAGVPKPMPDPTLVLVAPVAPALLATTTVVPPPELDLSQQDRPSPFPSRILCRPTPAAYDKVRTYTALVPHERHPLDCAASAYFGAAGRTGHTAEQATSHDAECLVSGKANMVHANNQRRNVSRSDQKRADEHAMRTNATHAAREKMWLVWQSRTGHRDVPKR